MSEHWREDREHWLDEERNHELHRIADALEKIAHCVCKPAIAVSSTLTFKKGENMAQANVSDAPGSYLYQEFDGPGGTGNVVPPTGTVAYASDNPAVATIDAVSGQLTYIAAGVANISASDSGNLPSADPLTLTPGVVVGAVSSTLTFTPGVSPQAAVIGGKAKAPASKQ
jgi:hypothetical protein